MNILVVTTEIGTDGGGIYKYLNFPTSRIDEKRDLDLENYI